MLSDSTSGLYPIWPVLSQGISAQALEELVELQREKKTLANPELESVLSPDQISSRINFFLEGNLLGILHNHSETDPNFTEIQWICDLILKLQHYAENRDLKNTQHPSITQAQDSLFLRVKREVYRAIVAPIKKTMEKYVRDEFKQDLSEWLPSFPLASSNSQTAASAEQEDTWLSYETKYSLIPFVFINPDFSNAGDTDPDLIRKKRNALIALSQAYQNQATDSEISMFSINPLFEKILQQKIGQFLINYKDDLHTALQCNTISKDEYCLLEQTYLDICHKRDYLPAKTQVLTVLQSILERQKDLKLSQQTPHALSDSARALLEQKIKELDSSTPLSACIPANLSWIAQRGLRHRILRQRANLSSPDLYPSLNYVSRVLTIGVHYISLGVYTAFDSVFGAHSSYMIPQSPTSPEENPLPRDTVFDLDSEDENRSVNSMEGCEPLSPNQTKQSKP